MQEQRHVRKVDAVTFAEFCYVSELTLADFPDTQLSISTFGRFKLKLTMVRGAFPSSSLLTQPFEVMAAALIITDSDIKGVYIIGDVLGDVTVSVSLCSSRPHVLGWAPEDSRMRGCVIGHCPRCWRRPSALVTAMFPFAMETLRLQRAALSGGDACRVGTTLLH